MSEEHLARPFQRYIVCYYRITLSLLCGDLRFYLVWHCECCRNCENWYSWLENDLFACNANIRCSKAWSNRPIPMPMFKASFQPVIRNGCTWKMLKKTTHARMESVLSLSLSLRCFFWHFSCAFIAASQTLRALSTTGWKPALTLPLCRTSTVDQCDAS